MGDPSSSVGPGFGAFVAFFLLALALWLLMRNMNARMRRMAYREQERVRALVAEQTDSAGKPAGGAGQPGSAGQPDTAEPEPPVGADG